MREIVLGNLYCTEGARYVANLTHMQGSYSNTEKQFVLLKLSKTFSGINLPSHSTSATRVVFIREQLQWP